MKVVVIKSISDEAAKHKVIGKVKPVITIKCTMVLFKRT